MARDLTEMLFRLYDWVEYDARLRLLRHPGLPKDAPPRQVQAELRSRFFKLISGEKWWATRHDPSFRFFLLSLILSLSLSLSPCFPLRSRPELRHARLAALKRMYFYVACEKAAKYRGVAIPPTATTTDAETLLGIDDEEGVGDR